jgi:hypothetical protein
MARNRIIYQSEALFVSATGVTGSGSIKQIHRVQSANYSFDLSRQDINQFGQLAALDRIILEQPTVALDFSYYVESGEQEDLIGFDIDNSSSAISGILKGDDLSPRADMQTYFITTSTDGDDNAGFTGNPGGVIGIGNAFMTSYSVEGGVGDFISASVNCEGLNIQFSNTATDVVPDPTMNSTAGTLQQAGANIVTMPLATAGTGVAGNPKALRHGDVSLALGTGQIGINATGAGDFHAQNFSFSFELSRTNLEKLGSRFAYSKEIEFPSSASLDVSAIVGDLNGTNDAMLEDYLNDAGDTESSPAVSCSGAGSTSGLKYTLLGAKLDSQGFSSSIGDNKTVDLSYSTQIGGPQDTTHGIKMDKI